MGDGWLNHLFLPVTCEDPHDLEYSCPVVGSPTAYHSLNNGLCVRLVQAAETAGFVLMSILLDLRARLTTLRGGVSFTACGERSG